MIMDNPQFVTVYTANGKLSAEMIKAFLGSQGIEAMVSQESAGSTYGLTVGPLGEVDILVEQHDEARARQVLADMEKGKFALDSSDENINDPEDE